MNSASRLPGNAIGWDPKTGTWDKDQVAREACASAPAMIITRPKEFWVTDESEAEEIRLVLILGGGALVLTWGYYRFSR